MQQSEKINITQERNQRALNVFTSNGFSVQLFGDDEYPMFILENCILLSCFLNGNNLYFRHSPDSGEILRSVKLTGNEYLTKYEISQIIEQSEHLPVYRIKDNGSGMWLVGFNYFEQEDDRINRERYPVFALHKPKIYIDQNRVASTTRELEVLGYDVSVI
jgi:hypothetical protein